MCDVVQSHVEALMAGFLGTDDLQIDEDGDIAVRSQSARYIVRVRDYDRDCPHVEVFAVMVNDVDADPGLFEALNEINRRATHTRAFWLDRMVVLANQLVGLTMSSQDLTCACDEVAFIAHRDGPRLAATFGGHVAFPEALEEGQ